MVKILIVEDEIEARNGIAMLISESSLPCKVVDLAEDGYDGMMKAKCFSPDLIITDIKMPRMDGLTMIENITGWGMSPQFIILSGYAEFSYAQKALKFGVLEYLLKPITADELLGTLYNICSKLSPKKTGDTSFRLAENPDVGYPPIVTAIIRYIKENYNCQISIQDIAQQMRITPEYASNIFSKATGRTFTEYLRDVRLSYAKEMLLSTDDKIYEIAYRIGYNDVKYFSRIFKKCIGVTAKEFSHPFKI